MKPYRVLVVQPLHDDGVAMLDARDVSEANLPAHIDNIPIDACTERRIPVPVVGSANAASVGEQTVLLNALAALDGALDRSLVVNPTVLSGAARGEEGTS